MVIYLEYGNGKLSWKKPALPTKYNVLLFEMYYYSIFIFCVMAYEWKVMSLLSMIIFKSVSNLERPKDQIHENFLNK